MKTTSDNFKDYLSRDEIFKVYMKLGFKIWP